MTQRLLLATLAFIGLLAFGAAANAEPIDIELVIANPDGAVVTPCDCGINVDVAGGLGTVIGSLDIRDHLSFDFLDISFDGEGVGIAIIAATLSFLEPDVLSVGVGGLVPFLSIEGFIDIVAGLVIIPDILAQVGDSILNISFDDVFLGLGGGATITATITRVATAVPEPGTLALMMVGLGMLVFMRRRKLAVGRFQGLR